MKTNTLDFDAQALRERILDLAMRGKLVPQDPNDEPASTLLKSCDLKSANEQPHVIPRSWEWIVLGSVVKFINGRAYKKTELLEDKSLTPVLRVGNLFTNSSWYYSDLQLDPDKYIDNGDLIYAWSASFGPRIWDGGHVIYHYHIWKLVLDQVVDKNYLYYFLLDKRNVIGETDLHGSTMKHITKTNMEHLSFPLPPLIEQQRIAAKIAQLFALLRKVETSTQQYAELQTLLKSKVLDLAMRGELVKQDPNDEPASVLLEKIKAEKAELVKEKKINKSKPLPPITDEEKPFDIPDSWEWVRLGDIFSINDRNKADDNLNVGFLPMKNIKDGYNNSFLVEQKKWGEVRKGYTHIRVGVIALSKITPCFQNRKSCVITDLPNKIGAATTEIYALYPMLPVLSDLYIYFLKSSFFIAEGTKNFTGNVGQQRVPKKFVEDFVIPLPPEKEISRIITKIENLFKIL